MTTAHVFIAASLDGFIARETGDIDWLTPNGASTEDHGFDAFYGSVDGTIMGRGTWETVSTFDPWPFDKPVIVLSNTLKAVDLPAGQQGKVRVWNATPTDAMKRVADEGWRRAYVDGGRLIQSFLRDGLVSDLIITRIPVLLGRGRPLFGHLENDIVLSHVETTSFPSGLVQSRYAIIG